MCHETASASVCRGNLSKCLQSSSAGKCGKPNKYRCDFSFRCSIYIWMQYCLQEDAATLFIEELPE